MADYAHVLRIRPHPANIRSDTGSLSELTASIRAQGILQPLIVQPMPGRPGQFLLLAGHRRLAAAKLAGLDEVPVEIRQAAGPDQAVVVMLVENCQRSDLNPMDKAEAMGRLRDLGYSQARIAREVGLASGTVSYYLSLLELDGGSRERVRTAQIGAATAVAAVRGFRARNRKKQGTPKVGATWEPDHLAGTHPLARKAHALCQARDHSMRRRIGKTACGQCWETVIRQDEQLAVRTLRAVPDAEVAGA